MPRNMTDAVVVRFRLDAGFVDMPVEACYDLTLSSSSELASERDVIELLI